MTTVRQNPGPGAYDSKTGMSLTGSYQIAGFKNSKAPSFSLPSLKRFNYDSKITVPGPQAYSPKIGIADSASSFISTFKSAQTRSHYHSNRQTIDIPNHIRALPGPGAYNTPSEFGVYESKHMKKRMTHSVSQQALKWLNFLISLKFIQYLRRIRTSAAWSWVRKGFLFRVSFWQQFGNRMCNCVLRHTCVCHRTHSCICIWTPAGPLFYCTTSIDFYSPTSRYNQRCLPVLFE